MTKEISLLKNASPETGKPARLSRRAALKCALGGMALTSIPFVSSPAMASKNYSAWRVFFKQAHTGESFSGVYRVGDKYLPEAFDRLNYVLRDFRTGEVFPMDPHVIDIMSLVQMKSRQNGPLEILSGYRSPKTNNMLRKASTGVARNSLHMYGQAIDMRLPGFSTQKLAGIARNMKIGGVGYYARSNFIHIDTGRVRSWS